MGGGDVGGGLGQGFWGNDVGRGRDQLTGQNDTVADRLGGAKAAVVAPQTEQMNLLEVDFAVGFIL